MDVDTFAQRFETIHALVDQLRQQAGRLGTLDQAPLMETVAAMDSALEELHRLLKERQGRASALTNAREPLEQARFKGLLEAAPDAIVIANRAGQIELINRQTEALFGYAREESLGQAVEIFLPERFHDLHRHHRAQYVTAPAIRPMGTGLELYGRRKDGSEFPVEISLSPVGTGDSLRVISSIRDVSARKQADDERLQLLHEARAAIRARDELLSMVTHDLKGPVAVIRGNAYLIQGHLSGLGDAAPFLSERVAQIDAANTRMARMINELLDMARLRVGQSLKLDCSLTDLVALAHQIVDEHQRGRSEHAILISADVPTVTGNWDSARLERVLDNLLANAIKYSPDGGTVTVTVTRKEDAAGEWAVLSVSDQGMGIPPADLPHIFEPFWRGTNVVGRFSGTGIGLASAHWIVEQHGGTIAVASEEGVGSTFTVRLPLGSIKPGHDSQESARDQ